MPLVGPNTVDSKVHLTISSKTVITCLLLIFLSLSFFCLVKSCDVLNPFRILVFSFIFGENL